MSEKPEQVIGWAVIELFGHQKAAGYVTEATIAGSGFLRVDVPESLGGRPAYTRYLGPSAIYSVLPVPEAVARACAENMYQEPIRAWQLALPAMEDEPRRDEPDDDDDEKLPF
jgi:hypothetical protein